MSTLPLILLLALLQGAALLVQAVVAPVADPAGAGTLIPILVAVTLIALSHRIRIDSLVGWAICALAALAGFVGFVWFPLSEWVASAPMVAWGCSLLRHSLSPMVVTLLGWGAINQVTSLPDAARKYFLIALSSTAIGQLPRLLPPMNSSLFIAAVVLLLVGALLSFKWVQSSVAEKRWERDPFADPLPSPQLLFGAALMVGLIVAAERLVQPISAAALFAGAPLATYLITLLAFALLGALLAPLLLRRFGWRWTAYGALGLQLLFGLSALLLGSTLLYSASLAGLRSALLLPLSMMLFLQMPPERRFAMAGWSLLWIYPLVSQLGDLLSSGHAAWHIVASLALVVGSGSAAYWMGQTATYRAPIR